MYEKCRFRQLYLSKTIFTWLFLKRLFTFSDVLQKSNIVGSVLLDRRVVVGLMLLSLKDGILLMHLVSVLHGVGSEIVGEDELVLVVDHLLLQEWIQFRVCAHGI